MANHKVEDLHNKYIKGTGKESVVQFMEILVIKLTKIVTESLFCPCNKVYINTRALKHIYDKRPAEEYDFLVQRVHIVIRYPDVIYKAKDSKRGNYCFVKILKNKLYLCSIEIIERENDSRCEVVTFFRVPKEGYLKNYELLWEWKGGAPSS